MVLRRKGINVGETHELGNRNVGRENIANVDIQFDCGKLGDLKIATNSQLLLLPTDGNRAVDRLEG